MTDIFKSAEERAAYLERRLADALHSNSVLLGAIEAVCCGARSLEQLRAWHEGPREKGGNLYSWREERRELLARLAATEQAVR